MTMETIETAIRGMQAGMDGIHDMGKTMEKTAKDMKEELDKWIQEMQTKVSPYRAGVQPQSDCS